MLCYRALVLFLLVASPALAEPPAGESLGREESVAEPPKTYEQGVCAGYDEARKIAASQLQSMADFLAAAQQSGAESAAYVAGAIRVIGLGTIQPRDGC